MNKNKKDYIRFSFYLLVSLIIILIFSVFIYFGNSIDMNYIYKNTVGFIFAISYIVISILFIVYLIFDLIKKINYFGEMSDKKHDLVNKIFIIYLSSIYILGALLAIIL